jgi:hypothetical protein
MIAIIVLGFTFIIKFFLVIIAVSIVLTFLMFMLGIWKD